MIRITKLAVLSFFLMFAFQRAIANVKLPSIFSDNMVFQQKTNATIWGTADANSVIKITALWASKKIYSAKADAAGNWKIKVPTPSYGGPYTVKISQGNIIVLNNVMIGEVWLCSGQSNMEMPLAGWGKVNNYKEEIANAKYPRIRLLQAIHIASNKPLNDLTVRNKGWDECSPETIADFSATAYFFAREIYTKTKIPIGLIHSSWGGTIAEAWTSYETLKMLPDFAAAAKEIKDNSQNISAENYQSKLEKWQAGFEAKDKGYKGADPIWAANDFNTSSWKTMVLPVLWENDALNNFDGIVWFRKKISLPENWVNDDITLSLGTIDDEDITWFNGVKIGETKMYNAERIYIVPKTLLKVGENIITVKVTDTGGGGGLYGESSSMFVKNSSGDKITLAGNWLYNQSLSLADLPARPADPNNPNSPTVLYNAMINPIINYGIKGAIWYQGESNAGRAYQYQTLLPAMIKDWRAKFSSGDFPFYIVQLANFMKKNANPGSSDWAELREAQLKTTSLKNTGMAVTIDIGDAIDIHPKNKQDVGKRLALIALNKVYGNGNEYSGPLYQSFKIDGNKIRVKFDHAQGMFVKGNKLAGFEIAGTDQKFYWADAAIQGDEVIVSSKEVNMPVAVRYGWSANPDANLYNAAQLPASPFRTDNWHGITFGNK